MRLFSILIIFCLGLAGCGSTAKNSENNNSSDDALAQMDNALAQQDEMTPEDEYYLGRAVAANILSSYKPYEEKPALTKYLNTICAALVIHSDKPILYNGYHLMILDSPEFNAFATSGGHIFITRGLISAAESEDALAAVIAHEIDHIQLRHGVQLVEDMRLTDELSTIAEESERVAGQNDLNQRKELFADSVREMVTGMVTDGYSQSQEFDADDYAAALLAKTGYAPSGLIDVLKILESRQPGQAGGFNKTHPSPAQRIANAEGAAKQYPAPDTRSFRASRFQGAK